AHWPARGPGNLLQTDTRASDVFNVEGSLCSCVAGRCDASRGQKLVSSYLWQCGSHAGRSEASSASAASSSVLFGRRRWNRAKKVDPLSALGRLKTYVPHGEIGALRATFLDERHC